MNPKSASFASDDLSDGLFVVVHLFNHIIHCLYLEFVRVDPILHAKIPPSEFQQQIFPMREILGLILGSLRLGEDKYVGEVADLLVDEGLDAGGDLFGVHEVMFLNFGFQLLIKVLSNN